MTIDQTRADVKADTVNDLCSAGGIGGQAFADSLNLTVADE
jgi:hypothetical protein